jgi:hypothetical protein
MPRIMYPLPLAGEGKAHRSSAPPHEMFPGLRFACPGHSLISDTDDLASR